MTIAKLISLFFCGTIIATDIVQVDVGNAVDFHGILNMPHTEEIDLTSHGTAMAKALENELKLQKSKPVKAVQTVWTLKSTQSLWKALSEGLKFDPQVLSLSYGGAKKDSFEEAILFAFALNDTIIVAAAGNNGKGKDYYPANYFNPCLISVGTTLNGHRASYSNEADVWLEYNPMDPPGTSASTARAAAIVLQLKRQNPELSCKDIALTFKMLYGKIPK